MKIPHSITLVIVYFGKWPVWFPAFLLSCERNPDVTWLVFTDCPPPPQHPTNVRFVQTTMDSIRKLASERLGFEVALQDPRKLCDLKVTYGILFQEHLAESDFWGFCDIDVIWGNLRKFFPDPLLDAHDILTTRKGLIAGHLCLLRNTPELIALCTGHPDFKRMMQLPGYQWFDEVAFSDLVGKKAVRHGLRVYWPEFRVNFSKHVDALPSYLSWLDRFTWKDGALYCLAEGGKEIPYLHFMNWKNTLRWCGLDYGSKVTFFKVGYSGITTEQNRPSLGYRMKARLESFRKPSLYLLYFLRMAKRAMRR